MPPPLRLLLADDHAFFRRGLREVLEEGGEMRVVAEAADGEEAVRLVRTLWPGGLDLVLLDIEMPRLDGIGASKRILAEAPGLPVVMLTASTDDQDLLTAAEVGALGFLTKGLAPEALVRALRDFHREGALPMSRPMAAKVLAHLHRRTRAGEAETAAPLTPPSNLTPRAHGTSASAGASGQSASSGTGSMARVLLVEDHPSFRQALAFMLGQASEIGTVEQAGSLAEARGMLAKDAEIDVAVLDLNLPDGHGTDLIRDVHAANPGSRVLILTASANRYDAARVVEAGADGILLKTATVAEILDAVRRLAAGEQLLSQREVIERLRLAGQRREEEQVARQALARLTPRECEVLQALADGLNDREMAERLHLSVRTARTHMVNILAKLGVESRLQALIFALRHGIARLD